MWATTEKGKTIPLNPDPSPDGNLILFEDRPGRVVRFKAPLLEPGMVAYTSHFATCPNADRHRRRR